MNFYYEKYKLLRKEKKISAKEISNKLSIVRSTLWKWETGKCIPPEHCVKKMAEQLCIPVSEISDLHEEEENSTMNLSYMMKMWTGNSEKIEKENQYFVQTLLEKMNMMQFGTVVTNAILSSVQSIIYIKDINNNYAVVNKTFRRLLSIPDNVSIENKTESSFLSLREGRISRDIDRSVLERGNSLLNKEDFIIGSNKKKWGLYSRHPIYDSCNKICGMICIINDITEIKYKERVAVLLEKALKFSHDVVYLKCYYPTNKLLYISDSVKDVSGYDKKNFINNNRFWIDKCVHEEDTIELKKLHDANSWQENKPYIYRIVKPNGEIRWMEARYTFLDYMKNKCFAVIERDVTDRKNAEELQEILNINVGEMNDGLFIRSLKTGELVYMNSAALKILDGYNINPSNYSSLVKNIAEKILHPDHKDCFLEYIERGNWAPISIWKYYNQNRSVSYLEARISKDIDYKKEEYSITIIRDVTEYITFFYDIMELACRGADECFMVFDNETGSILFSNNQVVNTFGYSKTFMDKYDFWLNKCVYPDDRKKIISLERISNLDKIIYRTVFPNGEIKLIESTRFFRKFKNKNFLLLISRPAA
jgi:PAS domain S-box-containing protein